MLEDREIAILIEEIYKYHGYDFSGYSAASFRRRVERLYQMDRFEHFSDFLSKNSRMYFPNFSSPEICFLLFIMVEIN